MGTVPALLKQRWASRNLVGDAKHSCKIRIRQGYIDHLYQPTELLDTSPDQTIRWPTIWRGNNSTPWQGQWTPTGDWIDIADKNVQSAGWSRTVTGNGGSTLTVVLDNIADNEATGIGGMYHTINRGWFSPTRGVRVASRPDLWDNNAWTDVFNGGYQIEVTEGYGIGSDVVLSEGEDSHWTAPSASRTWIGVITNCDMESHPDHITLTARDYSLLLTDQRAMGQNKAREIRSPITFASKAKTLGETKEFGSVSFSSGSFAADEQLGAAWRSGTHADSSHTEWVEIRLPAGHYEDFYADFAFTGETMWVSLKAAGGNSKMDVTTSVPDGWIDLGLGTVPVDGEPYILMHANTVSAPSRRWSLGGHTWELGDGSILRLSFTSLVPNPDTGLYQAGTDAFYAFRYGTNPATVTGVKATGWILVEDAADVVRQVLLWAGFHEFDVQDFGWTLQAPMVFGQDAFFQEIIDAILAQGNFVFFVDAPTDHDMSLGVPVFRKQTATDPPREGMLTVRDQDMVEALQVQWDMSNAPYVMRYRGAITPNGTTLFADLTKRYTGTYWPPWSGHDYTNLQGNNFVGGFPLGRQGGVRRQFAQTDPSLTSVAECLFACILAAIQYALQMVTGNLQIAGLPGLAPNQQISIVDEGTGTNARMWVDTVSSQHTLGPNGSWHMTVSGSMVDTEDMQLIAQDYFFTVKRYEVYKVGL